MLCLANLLGNEALGELAVLRKNAYFKCFEDYLGSIPPTVINAESLKQALQSAGGVPEQNRFSTFFYSLIKIIAQDDSRTHDDACFLLLLLVIDSLFFSFSGSRLFKVRCSIEGLFTMPCLNVKVNLTKGLYLIEKADDKLILHYNDLDPMIIKIDNLKEDWPLLCLVKNDYLRRLFIEDQVLYDEIGQEFVDKFQHKLNAAVIKLNELEPSSAALLKRIEFIVPLQFVNKDVTKSFTLSALSHVVFLSDSDSELKLMENMIHECLHDELNTFMNFYNTHRQTEAVYYSPWREDPRPIRGLIHAIYVFTGICCFYKNVIATKRISPEDRKFIIFRYNLLYYELELAFSQVNKSLELTTVGKRLIDSLRNLHVDSKSKFIENNVPRSVLEHVEKWMKMNAAIELTLPEIFM